MNRRGFLKLLGLAAAGTVAYSFPTEVVCKNIERVPAIIPVQNDYGVLTFSKLNKAYEALRDNMGCEPHVMVVNRKAFEYINENIIPAQLRFAAEGHNDLGYGHLKFRGTILEPSDFIDVHQAAGSYGMVGVKDGIQYRDMSIKVAL